MKKETNVFIILDAFRWDYINPEDTPLLYRMSQKGMYAKKLITSTGFTQRSAIFCGTPSDVTDNFTMFSFDPSNSPFRFLRPYKPLLKLVQTYINKGYKNSGKLDHKLREEIIYPRTKKYASHAPPAWIPLHILPFIGITEDEKVIYDKGGMSVDSIFDRLYDAGIGFEYLMFPVTNCEDNSVLETTLSRVVRHSRLYLLQFSDSDMHCHHHGTNVEERHNVTKEIDRKLSVLKESFEKNFNRVNWLIIGDHGMTDIKETVNIEEVIITEGKKRGLVHGRDYLFFLDSTMARLWALKDRAGSFVEEVFTDSKLKNSGVIIDHKLARKYRIPYRNRKYGDVIWWANPGVLIAPDYFHPRSYYVKGMHGYDSYFDDMKGFAILHSDLIKQKEIEEISLIDICPTLCDLLKVRYPAKNEGVSMLAGNKYG